MTKQLYCYRAYGLDIHSMVPLFNLPVSQAINRDVLIDTDTVNIVGKATTDIFPYELLTSQEAIFSIDGAGRFRISSGNRITVDPASECDWLQVQRYLVGPAIALLLYQRNRLVLHASAISMNGQGVAFLGDSGAGKSSIAAAFLANGHKLVVDDVVSARIEAGTAWVDPGFPFIKLSSEAANLILHVEEWEIIDKFDNKISYRLDHYTDVGQVRLRDIYIILPGEGVELVHLSSQQALFELMRYSVPVRMVKLNHVQQFKRCIELLNCVNVYGIRRPASITHLPSLVEMVEGNLHHMRI